MLVVLVGPLCRTRAPSLLLLPLRVALWQRAVLPCRSVLLLLPLLLPQRLAGMPPLLLRMALRMRLQLSHRRGSLPLPRHRALGLAVRHTGPA